MRTAAGVLGAVAGFAAAGATAGVAVERTATRRLRHRPDPLADEPYALLPADQTFSVSTVDGLRLHAEIVGHGDEPLTVVFVHGYCLDMGTWHFQRRGLPGTTDPPVRMVFYDQRGHGRSGRGEPATYTIDQLGRDLDDVLAATAPQGPLVLVGHSMGGMAIMALADQRPELFAARVVGVALVSTSGGELDAVSLGFPRAIGRLRKPLTPLLSHAMRRRAHWIERVRTAGHDVTWLITRRWAFGSAEVSPGLVDYVEQMNSQTPIDTVAGFLATLSDHRRATALRVLEGIETMILVGDRDLMTPPEHSRRLAEALPGCELVEIADGGHLTVMEHPEQVNDLLRHFVHRAARAWPAPASRPRRRR